MLIIILIYYLYCNEHTKLKYLKPSLRNYGFKITIRKKKLSFVFKIVILDTK